MSERVSPLAVQIMIECHLSADPGINFHRDVWLSHAAERVRERLVAEGLIEPCKFTATARGSAWVNFICQTPLPMQTWVLPDRERTL